MSEWTKRLLHLLRLPLGRGLAAVRLHRLNRVPASDPEWLSKRRKRWADLIVRPGNLSLRLQGALSEVLHCEEWIAWEVAVAERLGRSIRISDNRRAIEVPCFAGRSLDELLRTEASSENKLRAVWLSARALWELHQVTVPDGWPFSHGDATSRNVIVDLAGDVSQWIDFDMRHRRDVATRTRHADDMRALLWSCATGLEPSEYPALVKAIWEGYADVPVLDEVRSLTRRGRCPTVLELGQAALSPAQLQRLRESL